MGFNLTREQRQQIGVLKEKYGQVVKKNGV